MGRPDPGSQTVREHREIQIMERAEVMYWEPPIVRNAFWRAEDPETGCVGGGKTEGEARGNLVYAVDAYHRADDPDVGYYSTGPNETVRMAWQRPGRFEAAINRLRSFFQ